MLYQALRYEPGTHVVSSGALATTSGQKTGRSPKDKRVVREEDFEKDVWWGKYSPNYMMDDRWAAKQHSRRSNLVSEGNLVLQQQKQQLTGSFCFSVASVPTVLKLIIA
jgi:ATP-dependent phosphoenolpyruvate carboxykinase